MNSIARALNNIALSITQLTAAVASATAKKIEESTLSPKTLTSNPAGGHVTVTAITTSQPASPKVDFPKKNPFTQEEVKSNKDTTYPYAKKQLNDSVVKKVIVFKEEQLALESLYAAITNKGVNPKYHDKMMRQLREGWPVLHKALLELIAAHEKHYNPNSSKYYTNDVWKASHNNWDK
jgi:hypothetical protein